MNHAALSRTCIAALAVVGAALVVAGPLNPPAGPVTGTHKTLTEVEPRTAVNGTNTPGDADSLYKITQPGSYYLAGNITGVTGKHGVEITSSGVTLDLNGFDLVGVPGMGAFDGVSVTVDSLRGIAVLNGSVRNWGDGGVDLGFLSRGCRVEGVRASGNAGTGITSSISSTVTNCTSSFNGQRGIFSSNGSTISNCSVESNSGNGIQVNHGCTVSACGAYFNTLDGVFAGTGCRVTDTSAYQNLEDGINVGEGATVSNCVTSLNDANGINCGNNSTVRGCTSTRNDGYGIEVDGGVVIECVTSNNLSGITVGNVSIVKDCTSDHNSSHGIFCLSESLIVGNHCSSNGLSNFVNGFGIVCNGVESRIVDNFCASNDQGIVVGQAGNVILRNSCANNQVDWVIAAGNAVGPILDRRVPGGAAINGFSAPTTLNTTDPHANFSH